MSKKGSISVMARLSVLVKPLAGYMLLAILLGLFGHLCATFITILGCYAAAQVLGFSVPFSMQGVFIMACLFALARALFRYGEQYCNHFIAFKLLALTRDRVFTALRRLCPAKLDGREKGNLIALITSDIELLELFYAHTISPIAIALMFSVVMCLFIASFHPLLGFICLMAHVAVGLAVPLVASKRMGDAGVAFRAQSGSLASFVLDSLRGLSETQQYGQGKRRLQDMNAMTDSLSQTEERMKCIAGENQALTNVVILAFDLLMLFSAALLYEQKQIHFSGMLVATVALMSSFGPAVALSNLGATLQNTMAAGNRVLAILDEEPITRDITGKEEVVFSGAALDHVTFSYEADTILDKLSANFPKGQLIGMVGKSGSGKSTVLKLLMRFWDVQGGRVSISGKDIANINTANLRNMEALVTQETHLFYDSIRNNLRIANLDASDEDIIQACQKASVHDFIISLPQGYDTQVGELGDRLSGGERQRIGLARAFLHDAPFMLLDEPTSNLDSLNEAAILKALHQQKGDKTVVLVSHRESCMRIAEQVIAVDSGRIS